MPDKNPPTYVVGFPRIGEKRELKRALERFWSCKTGFDTVLEVSKNLRRKNWQYQKDAGISFIGSNDFSLYDGMLDTAVMLGAIPERFKKINNGQECYFAMARGTKDAVAMEMTKWFNTNYHYIVPELSTNMGFALNPDKITAEYREAKELGIPAKINIIGPVTFLLLSKRVDGGNNLDLLPEILPLYAALLERISKLDDKIYIQFDEPFLVKDPDHNLLDFVKRTYEILAQVSDNLNLIVMTYFDHAVETVEALREIPLYGLGLDFVYGAENFDALNNLNGKKLIAGIVDGRNIWRNDYKSTLEILEMIGRKVDKSGIIISTSCSLMHVPYSLEYETALDSELLSRLSFAKEKLGELADIAKLSSNECKTNNISEAILNSNNKALLSRKNMAGKSGLYAHGEVFSNIKERKGTFFERNEEQKKTLGLPVLPTTTIGSFPQTEAIRKLRKDYKTGNIPELEYDAGIKRYIDDCIKFQEEIGLDVLVHGEPERNDMVEYFGEKLTGFAFTENGWVQSYGSRCVKPPVIYGDITRPGPMTVETIAYAQSKTNKIMKGMLTGPVTILNWSFVRNDIGRSIVCEQIALAIRDEISDLQNAGIKIIQVDEAAFKEGYPLRRDKVKTYEVWAVGCFKLAVSAAYLKTQIHTHMCYSDFNSIIRTIEKMDADVITIETSRSGNKLLDVFKSVGYKNQIGPGVYDIHSPRVPPADELTAKIESLLDIFPASQLWINPDCGLKTRGWDEVKSSLINMVKAAKIIKKKLNDEG